MKLPAILSPGLATAGAIPPKAVAAPATHSKYLVLIMRAPDESPKDVFDLSRHFPGTRYVILSEGDDHAHWPEDIDASVPWAECFREIHIGLPPTRVFQIVCR